jgi:hypothetical protein
MRVFLDLEETVITDWSRAELINIPKIQAWLEKLGTTEAEIFSFAVWNEDDKARFWQLIAPCLERALNIKVTACASVEDFFQADRTVTGVFWENTSEFVSMRGKLDAFRSWCRLVNPHGRSVLLDDVVPNARWQEFDSGLDLEFVNVNSLK